MMEASKKLRRMLKERKIRYRTYDTGCECHGISDTWETMWSSDGNGPQHRFVEYSNGQTRLQVVNPTPEQALGVTLGYGYSIDERAGIVGMSFGINAAVDDDNSLVTVADLH